ncbi:MAG: hypothetical protein M1814_000595 [Vezdaea aestivalis]|nr:MAG: hypothetical protein M1814_000595 [Vezdaea aestivalis]
MHYSTLALFILAPIAFAIPNPAPVLELVYTDNGITSGTSDPANDKRDLIYTDGGITTPGDSDLSKRRSNYVSSCGPNWMKIYDDPAGKWQGYASAVKTFCFRQTHNGDEKPLILSSSQASSASISGGLQLTSGNPARVDYPDTNWLKDGCSSRSQVKDEDLIAVLNRLRSGIRSIPDEDHPGLRLAVIAPLPDRKNLPSSRSTDLRGRIPIADLKVLLKLLKSTATYESIEVKRQRQKKDWEALDAAGEEEEATASTLGLAVGWREFKKLSDRVPILFEGYKVLLSPFLEGPSDVSELESKPKIEAFEFIRQAYERRHNA